MPGGDAGRQVLWPISVLVLAGLLWIVYPTEPSDDGEAPPDTLEPLGSEPRGQGEAVIDALPGRSGEPGEAADAPSVTPREVDRTDRPRAEGELQISGRVLDVMGRPQAGFRVALVAAGAPVVSVDESDGAGRFTAEVTSSRGRLIAVKEGWLPLRGTDLSPTNLDREHVLVVGRPIRLSGRVSDEDGAPVAAASVRFELDERSWTDFPEPLDKTFTPADVSHPWRVKTSAEGSFRIERAVAAPGAHLRVYADRYRPAGQAAPAVDTDALEIVLEEVDDEDGSVALRVTGIVLDPEGNPMPGVGVRTNFRQARTDENGRFELEGSFEPKDLVLATWKEGYSPAVFEDLGRHLREHADAFPGVPPDPITLRLSEPLSIEGRLVGTDGRGRRGFRVILLDPTILDLYSVPFRTAEGPGWNTATEMVTGAGGRFEISGLRDRAYQLRFVDEDSLVSHESEPIEAGSRGVIVRLPLDVFRERLEGRVVDRAGRPIPKVSVRTSVILTESGTGHTSTSGKSTLTDSEGRFVLKEVPRRGLNLELAGETIVPETVEVPEEVPEDGLILTASRRCFIRVDAGESSPVPAGFSVLDAAGDELSIVSISPTGRSSTTWSRLEDGRSIPLAVEEDAATVVLYDDSHREVARIPIAPIPGEVLVVRP